MAHLRQPFVWLQLCLRNVIALQHKHEFHQQEQHIYHDCHEHEHEHEDVHVNVDGFQHECIDGDGHVDLHVNLCLHRIHDVIFDRHDQVNYNCYNPIIGHIYNQNRCHNDDCNSLAHYNDKCDNGDRCDDHTTSQWPMLCDA